MCPESRRGGGEQRGPPRAVAAHTVASAQCCWARGAGDPGTQKVATCPALWVLIPKKEHTSARDRLAAFCAGRARTPCPRAEAAERRCVQPSGWNRSDRLTSHQLPRPPRLLPRQLHPHPREAGAGCGRTCTPSVPCCARSPWRVAAVLGGGGCPSSLGLGLGVCRLAGRPGRGDLGLLTPDTHSARSAFSLLGYDTVRFGVFGNCQNVQRGCSKDLDRFAQRQR